MKKIVIFLIISALVLSLASCGGSCKHEWSTDVSDETLVSPADCTHAAVYRRVCVKCGMKGVTFNHGEPLGHTLEEYVDGKYLITEATCTEEGIYHKSCTVCGEAGGESFKGGSLAPHNWVKNANPDTLVGDASCSSAYTFCFTCADCGAHSEDVFTLGPVFPHGDDNGDEMCDSCLKALAVYYDVPIDNLTDIHDLNK